MQNTQTLTQQTIKQYPPTNTPVQDDGWLAPSGAFYPCGFCNHADCAEELESCGVWALEKKGYLHISDGRIRNDDQKPTQEQLNTLFDMMILDPHSYMGGKINSYLQYWQEKEN